VTDAAAIAPLLQQAFARHGAGDFAGARQVYERVLTIAPGQFDALHGLGIVCIQQRDHAGAEALLRRAVAANPRSAEAHSNHYAALAGLGRHDEALAACDRALAIHPRYPEALCNRGLALAALARYDEAIASYDAALDARPAFAAAAYHRGLALAALARHEEALASYDRALTHSRPSAAALYNRGVALAALGRARAALAEYDRALALAPDLVEAHNNRGGILTAQKQYDAAVASYDRALALAPDFAQARYNRGIARASLGRHADAAADFAQVVAQDPGLAFVDGMLLHARMQQADWRDFDAASARVVAAARAGAPSADPLTMLALSDAAADQLACARTWVTAQCPAVAAWPNDRRYAHERIRIAYLSADFREHAVAYLMADLLERHDRARFEVSALSFGPATGDRMRMRLEGAFDRFVDVREESDAEIARRMREMEIDIAIDLAGHTADARPGIFARRGAPVQVAYLGFPGTLGAPYYDYIVADRTVIPATRFGDYAEAVVWLPDTFQANGARPLGERMSRRDAGLPDEAFVLCAFNSTYKITPTLFALWMRLLARIPDGVLWLVGSDEALIENLHRAARMRGIDDARLVFAPRLPYARHLARYALADLFVDTLPFNAGTTASDALAAGCPVLTCSGDAFASRMAASLLAACGLPELVTQSLAEYEALALALAVDRPRLGALRNRLPHARDRAPLFDTDRFRRHLEAAYVEMHARAMRGEAPAHFAVEPL
jgi:predicted O-linked N-acetylglucosamine transferase (SPINDLY family)